MIKKKEGFTLIEILIILSLLSIISLAVISIPIKAYNKTLLKSTAIEIKEALHLSQHLSLDESRSYCVELIGKTFRIRQDVKGGRIVLTKQIHKNISIFNGSDNRISYNRNGETTYGNFVITNKNGQRIAIDTLIGTGKVRLSDMY